MISRLGLGCAAGLIWLLIGGAAGGGEKPSLFPGKTGEEGALQQPLRITAQELEADNKNRVITFRGKVEARQGGLIIRADTAQVFYEKKEEGNEIREVVASGNVKVQEGDRLATAQKAVFANREQKITLTGQPKIWQGKNMVSGERIVVLLREEKSFVESGPDRKAEVVLHPGGESRPGEGKP
jgi:lipopolysaccharide export system protein LptA